MLFCDKFNVKIVIFVEKVSGQGYILGGMLNEK